MIENVHACTLSDRYHRPGSFVTQPMCMSTRLAVGGRMPGAHKDIQTVQEGSYTCYI